MDAITLGTQAPALVKGAIRPTETYHNFDEELYDCPTGFVDAGFEDIPVGTYDWNKSPERFRKCVLPN
jgi:hypothetical protein